MQRSRLLCSSESAISCSSQCSTLPASLSLASVHLCHSVGTLHVCEWTVVHGRVYSRHFGRSFTRAYIVDKDKLTRISLLLSSSRKLTAIVWTREWPCGMNINSDQTFRGRRCCRLHSHAKAFCLSRPCQFLLDNFVAI